VHPAIIEAGKSWSKAPDVNPLAARELDEEDEDMSSPIGIRGEDIGLRVLRIQGKLSLLLLLTFKARAHTRFVRWLPYAESCLGFNNSFCLEARLLLCFQRLDQGRGGMPYLELQGYVPVYDCRDSGCLLRLSAGEYSVTCTLGILRHVLKYFAEYFATSDSSLPCALLLLQDLNPTVVHQLQIEDATAMRRCGADNLDPELKTALTDVVFIESDSTEAGAQVIERLWDDGTFEEEIYGRNRALRRLKADIAANDRAYRRLQHKANSTTVNPPPKLFTLGPPSHTKVRDGETSPAPPMFLCSPASSRSLSYGSIQQQQSSNSASTASLNTLGEDVSDESALPRIRPPVYDHDDSPPKSSEMRTKPLPPTEELQSRYHGLL
jgi:hypothetical protein